MIYVRYPRAAVATGTSSNSPPSRRNDELRATTAPLVLWASLALPVRNGGRLVGVRRRSPSEVEVAWIGPGLSDIQWMPASSLLTDKEARQWLKLARFSRQ